MSSESSAAAAAAAAAAQKPDLDPLPAAKKARISRTRWTFDDPCTEMESNIVAAASLSVSGRAAHEDLDADLVVVGMFGPDDDDDDKDDDKDDDNAKMEEEEKDKKGESESAAAAASGAAVALEGVAKDLDDELGGALSAVMEENSKSFAGGAKLGVATPTLRAVVPGKKGVAKRYVLLGLGKYPEDQKAKGDYGYKIGSAIASKCTAERGVKSVIVVLPLVNQEAVRDMSASFYSDLYSDNRYRNGTNVKVHAENLESVTIVAMGRKEFTASESKGMTASVEEGRVLAGGVFVAKDIVNAPHNVLNSESLANFARKIAADSGDALTCTILDKDQCEERNMGAYLAVARGSETQPQFIHIVYKPKSGEVKRKVGIVGKGLLFDTGGYNIKTGGMELMKFDCGGAAAVLGAARAIGELRPDGVEAHFIVAACENMINEKAFVPSDILTASNGKTIEVMNTDAEGRLTLADALVYADEDAGCEKIIELSTLTGACMVALGKKMCGVFTSDDDLANELDGASRSTSDKCWRMPMASEYNDQLESIVADVKNLGGRYGGAITAGLFLQHFVDKSKPFAHIDIAGPVWNDKTGATGFGAKLVTEWIRRQGV
mmetsp:Transcript_36387/g.109228  ORF Transcript_36387/g.109228 Transcript_36387/m.109228 type:complete len:606 (-) Transcript_36387:180-1997(-)